MPAAVAAHDINRKIPSGTWNSRRQPIRIPIAKLHGDSFGRSRRFLGSGRSPTFSWVTPAISPLLETGVAGFQLQTCSTSVPRFFCVPHPFSYHCLMHNNSQQWSQSCQTLNLYECPPAIRPQMQMSLRTRCMYCNAAHDPTVWVLGGSCGTASRHRKPSFRACLPGSRITVLMDCFVTAVITQARNTPCTYGPWTVHLKTPN